MHRRTFMGGLLLGLLLVGVRLQWARRERNECLNIGRWVEEGGRFEGVLSELPSGKWTLKSAAWLAKEGPPRPFSGDIRLSSVSPGFDSGESVIVSGRFRVLEPFRNLMTGPGAFAVWQPIVLVPQSAVVTRAPGERPNAKGWGARFREWVDERFRTAPGVRGLVRAVWTGDARGLPDEMKELFLEGGILQVLALSGQHVAGLIGLFLLVESLFGRWMPRAVWAGRGRAYVRRALPLAAGGLLLITSDGSPSLLRTFAMIAAIFLLRWRRLSTDPMQLLTTSVALMILIQPALSVSVSFFLSAAATALTFGIGNPSLRGRLLRSVFVSTAMPVLVFPMSAFLFSKIALSAPIYSLVVAWIWDLFLIPIGFALVPLIALTPLWLRASFLAWLERGWDQLVAAHLGLRDYLGAAYVAVISPTWLEFACLELLLLHAVLNIRRYLFPESRRS